MYEYDRYHRSLVNINNQVHVYRFPFDSQSCELIYQFDVYSASEVIFKKIEENVTGLYKQNNYWALTNETDETNEVCKYCPYVHTQYSSKTLAPVRDGGGSIRRSESGKLHNCSELKMRLYGTRLKLYGGICESGAFPIHLTLNSC